MRDKKKYNILTTETKLFSTGSTLQNSKFKQKIFKTNLKILFTSLPPLPFPTNFFLTRISENYNSTKFNDCLWACAKLGTITTNTGFLAAGLYRCRI